MVELDPLIRAFYRDRYVEADRLARSGHGRLEFLRTQELLRRWLPPASVVLDVGGATGAHARWLASDGHHVTLVDPVVEHVQQADDDRHLRGSRRRCASPRPAGRERRRDAPPRPAVPPGRGGRPGSGAVGSRARDQARRPCRCRWHQPVRRPARVRQQRRAHRSQRARVHRRLRDRPEPRRPERFHQRLLPPRRRADRRVRGRRPDRPRNPRRRRPGHHRPPPGHPGRGRPPPPVSHPPRPPARSRPPPHLRQLPLPHPRHGPVSRPSSRRRSGGPSRS